MLTLESLVFSLLPVGRKGTGTSCQVKYHGVDVDVDVQGLLEDKKELAVATMGTG